MTDYRIQGDGTTFIATEAGRVLMSGVRLDDGSWRVRCRPAT